MRIPSNSTPQAAQLRIDKRNHVLKPLLDQLSGLGRAIIDNEKEAAGV
jgi:hypothetical protein